MPRRGSQSPPLLNLPLLIIILPTIAILTLLILAFPSSSSTSFTFPPRTTASVRKSWDSFNVVLVLFAILCGVFARRNDTDDSHATASQTIDDSDERQGVHSQWYSPFSEQKFYEEPETTSVGGLKRNSSSYPDLRQESLRETGNDRFRFLDDFELGKVRYLPASPGPGNRRRVSSPIGSPREKEIRVDTVSWKPKSATPPPPPPPLPRPPSAAVSREPKRSYESIPRREKEIKEVPQPPPPPPPPRPPPVEEESKSERRNGRKRSNATKEIKSVLTSLYNSQRKRKKKYKMRDSSKGSEPAYPPPEPEKPSLARPPPPPPPPPPSLFHGFFRKGSKTKRIHSLSAPPPRPPLPPPAVSITQRNDRAPKPAPPPETIRRRSSAGASWRPPLPTPGRTSAPLEEFDNLGVQSPLIPMPPPPPPPFKVPGFRFVVRGDYVKVRSASSSLCSSPDRDEIEPESTAKINAITGGGGGPVSCPSPDVNVKADSFIARLRDGWRLEKMDYAKGGVYMGRGPGPI